MTSVAVVKTDKPSLKQRLHLDQASKAKKKEKRAKSKEQTFIELLLHRKSGKQILSVNGRKIYNNKKINSYTRGGKFILKSQAAPNQNGWMKFVLHRKAPQAKV